MNKIKLDTHTVISDILTSDGWALDVGCRGFVFTELLAKRGLNVIGLDPDKSITYRGGSKNITYIQKALTHTSIDKLFYASWSTGEGNFITADKDKIPHYAEVSEIDCTTIESIMQDYNIGVFDIIKLDCEGSEYEILMNLDKPVAKQISVEYHDFTGYCGDNLDGFHRRIWENLSKWYDVVQHDKTHLLGKSNLPLNYWDSVYILKKHLLNNV